MSERSNSCGMPSPDSLEITWWSSWADFFVVQPCRFFSVPLVSRWVPRHAFSTRIMRETSARTFQPRLPSGALRRVLGILSEKHGRPLVEALRERAARATEEGAPSAMEETAILRVLADLASIGWQFRVVRWSVYLIPRRVQQGDRFAAKALLREALVETRDQQLAEPSTIEFFRQMHSGRPGAINSSSVEVLVEDGARLANDLRNARGGDLSGVIQPFVQFVDATTRCTQTGLLLNDIWRYFRHTWSLEFRSTPGRNLNYLIRNAARPGHPVMGIVGLTNAVYQLTTRDEWVGWTELAVVKRLLAEHETWIPFLETALKTLESARSNIREDDIRREAGKPKSLLEMSRRFERIAEEQKEARKMTLRAQHSADEESVISPRAVQKKRDGSIDWKKTSEVPLFKRKRAETVSKICFALHHLANAPKDGDEIAKRVVLVERPDGQEVRWTDEDLGKAVRAAIREIKKNGVSSRILDVNVCGAAPTYRELLGGKLAAMSLFSSEVQDAYLERYAKAPSEIASAMAGRPICKQAHISVLTTTSLYEVGSSQYNRVRVRFSERLLEWMKIGETEGFGSVHFSKPTIDSIRTLAVERRGMRNVNNVFGEGTSPLMRQMREGLSLLGFEPNDVLQHTNKRIVYAAEIYPEARVDLVKDRDTYSRGPSFVDIAKDWQARWLQMRIQNETALERVEGVSAATLKRDLLSPSLRNCEVTS